MKRMMMWCLPALLILAVGCTKDPVENLTEEESRIYMTNYDTTAQFQTYRTFSIADSVANVQKNQLVDRDITGIEAQFIAEIAQALESRGYQRVGRDQNPDMALALSRVTNTNTNVVSYNDYGGYYGDYWDPYYWDYPGYGYYFPTYYGVYESSETALMIDMFDLKNAPQTNQLRGIWSGMIRGYGIYNNTNVESQVAALFAQSPYLRYQ